MELNPIQNTSIQGLQSPRTTAKPQNALQQVSQTFQEALDALSQSQQNSDELMQKLAMGEDVELHQVMIAAEQTDVNFRVAVAIRDKLVEAYREIMRMAV
ncbi:MAG: Flagellar hook-basal body complex protein FliE [Anaerolineae bacterium]|jgi:flagellar hook-basal body complex protein FliE|nr:MAG: Flagellar hook-basal body complex protein FliE [Anaerolineae bacterium]